MQPAFTLRYARVQKRWTRRRTIVLVLLAVFGGSGSYFGCRAYENIRARVALLDSDPRLGPIDWSTVLASPALWRLAWELSSDPTAVSRLQNAPNGVAGVSLFGTDRDGLELDLQFPLTYTAGQLELRLTLKNTSRNTILVPPFRQLLTPVHDSGERRALWVFCSTALNWFSSGAAVVAPGTTKVVTLSVPAPARPVPTSVRVSTGLPAGGVFVLRIGPTEWREREVIRVYVESTEQPLLSHPHFWPERRWEPPFTVTGDFGTDSFSSCQRWEDVPRSAMEKGWEPLRVIKSVVEPVEPLPPMLFPDEQRPKPWETEYLP